METVQQALGTLVARPDVAGAVLASGEGLLVAARLPDGSDAEALAALAASLLHEAGELARAGRRGAPERLLLDADGGPMIACQLNGRGVLLVLAEPATDLGLLLFDLRHQRDALAALL